MTVELIHHSRPLSAADVLEPDAHRFQLQGIVKTGLFVDNIEGLHEHLNARGVDTDPRIGTDRGIGARFFILRDPDGNRIQVFERCTGGCAPSP